MKQWHKPEKKLRVGSANNHYREAANAYSQNRQHLNKFVIHRLEENLKA